MILLQLSSAKGPAECSLAVSKALKVVLKDAKKQQVEIEILEEEPETEFNTLKSVLLKVEGLNARDFAKSWHGTIQWVCQSPYRPSHRRKNWFIGGSFSEQQETSNSLEIRFEACRSSGPGGQHANKTDSAVRATDVVSGISVKVQSARSQHANKQLAKMLIQHKLENIQQQQGDMQKNTRHKAHQNIERGGAIRVFKGEKFRDITALN